MVGVGLAALAAFTMTELRWMPFRDALATLATRRGARRAAGRCRATSRRSTAWARRACSAVVPWEGPGRENVEAEIVPTHAGPVPRMSKEPESAGPVKEIAALALLVALAADAGPDDRLRARARHRGAALAGSASPTGAFPSRERPGLRARPRGRPAEARAGRPQPACRSSRDLNQAVAGTCATVTPIPDAPRPSSDAGGTVTHRKRIALIAHDNRKLDLLDWARFNRGTLAEHELFATGHHRRHGRGRARPDGPPLPERPAGRRPAGGRRPGRGPPRHRRSSSGTRSSPSRTTWT